MVLKTLPRLQERLYTREKTSYSYEDGSNYAGTPETLSAILPQIFFFFAEQNLSLIEQTFLQFEQKYPTQSAPAWVANVAR